jgi:hypothetical protein
MTDKYPRTYHLPFSPGCTSDDKRLKNVYSFLNMPVIVTEKIDGSNVCMTSEAVFARSHVGPPTHSSFDLAKQLHSMIKTEIPQGVSIFGEYAFAKHSIEYNSLPGYFMVFGVRDDTNGFWFSWYGVEEMVIALGIPTVPVLFSGNFKTEKELVNQINLEMSTVSTVGAPEKEGVVVRRIDAFSCEKFSESVTKYVRANHVQTDEHWLNQKIVRNRLTAVEM